MRTRHYTQFEGRLLDPLKSKIHFYKPEKWEIKEDISKITNGDTNEIQIMENDKIQKFKRRLSYLFLNSAFPSTVIFIRRR